MTHSTKLRFQFISCHLFLHFQRKTGGLVIWRSGTSISLYRGVSYEAPSVRSNKKPRNKNEISRNSLTAMDINIDYSETSPIYDVHAPGGDSGSTIEEKKGTELSLEVEYEDEVDKLLESLGPRYTDWPGDDPLPVDADLLPGIVPGYEPPFRILPYGVRSTLAEKEATSLRRLARVLPPHFALGILLMHITQFPRGLIFSFFWDFSFQEVILIVVKNSSR